DAWGIGTEARNPLRARHNVRTLVYQYTRCKAWISFDYDSVLVGAAMVDGTWGVPPIVLAYPFTLRDLDAALDEL
ncbi:MAG: hypothetical protein GWN58_41600, partial [Anaerolineae bacterium]|nr:hypothetical protein [Anaerolineae bacterium]